jgi:predicted nucleotidyltransferase
MKKKKYTLSKSQKDKIVESISSYLRENMERISTAYLFGSFAAADSFSDIDLGVIIKTDSANLMLFEIELENQLEKICGHPADVRILNRAPFSFCQNVIKHGIVILDRDPNFRADFEGNIRKNYFDFSRFRKQYLQEAANAPI